MRKIRKKFKRPKVSWDSDSIKENKAIAAEYGLRRMKEILISHEILRGFRQRARLLIAEKDDEKEKILIEKLGRMGLLVGDGKELDDVLALTVKNVLDRRLQTIIFRMGVATSPIHARQLIVHGHIKIGGRKVAFPSYLVPVAEEKVIEVAGIKPKPKKPAPPPAGSDKQDAPKAGEGSKDKPEGDAGEAEKSGEDKTKGGETKVEVKAEQEDQDPKGESEVKKDAEPAKADDNEEKGEK